MDEYLERETKWHVEDSFVLPTFDNVLAETRVLRSRIELTSIYFDTDENDLFAHGLTLRRRHGDDDIGWQLKVPADEGRTEIRTGPSETMPQEFLDLTTGVRLGRQLHTVATVVTTRDRYRILDANEVLVADIADDHVQATVPAHPGETIVWREIEAEAGPDTHDLTVIGDQLTGAGATRSEHSSKLARALGLSVSAPAPVDAEMAAADRKLSSYIRDQIGVIFAGDVALRRMLDPIHDTRVAIRRLRSTLRVFAPLLNDVAVGEIEAELKWFAGVLGPVRDCQVQRTRFTAAIDELDPSLVVGSVAAQLDNALFTRQTHARREVADVMDSPRYLALLTTLATWLTAPATLTGLPTSKSSAPRLRKRVRAAGRKADRRLAEGLDSDRDELLHRARKAAKRARYAAELDAAAKEVKHYKKIQTVLGEHQDSAVAAKTLLAVATDQPTPPAMNTFTLGVLHARELRLAAEARVAARQL